METGTIIIGIAIFILIFIPLVLAQTKRKNEEKVILNKLLKTAKDKWCTIEQYDIWNQSAIGIDSTNKTLFFIEAPTKEAVQINLNTIKQCRIVNASRVLENEDIEPMAVRKLELSFIKTHPEDEIRILFFDANISLQVDEELKLIKKWHIIIAKTL
ncbi:hypothetical protein DVK85_07580 [Flavobacterium arcticum]|uniref:Uncharacterized protein n=1 Tax=Flavobacterium arcticum TaxID=1784713 RepID=A0A345HBZ8_9FLAO|nr:hypothetical protein [Flavobacterium arcticum]AXG74108.1 hypothetical protein DVK85_07580 [Flavobacterium arcticum]KAF2507332.1 hypothetical protein E0W72_12315 [Flavobacterium arcticum]